MRWCIVYRCLILTPFWNIVIYYSIIDPSLQRFQERLACLGSQKSWVESCLFGKNDHKGKQCQKSYCKCILFIIHSISVRTVFSGALTGGTGYHKIRHLWPMTATGVTGLHGMKRKEPNLLFKNTEKNRRRARVLKKKTSVQFLSTVAVLTPTSSISSISQTVCAFFWHYYS